MATQIIGTPDVFAPVSNPIYFYLQSDHAADEGFKYLVDIYQDGTTTPVASRMRLFPRPGDLYGEVAVNQILSSSVSFFLNQNLHGFSFCPQNFFKYSMKFGEEYVRYWQFLIEYNTGGNITLSGNAQPHGFQVGDELLIAHTVPDSAKDGVFTVLSVPDANGIVIDCPFVSGGAGGIYVGTAVIATKRKSVYPAQVGISGLTVFNAAIPTKKINDYSSVKQYNMTTLPTYVGKFLTNVPNGYNVKPENSMWLNFYSTANTNNYMLEVTTNLGQFYFPNNLGSTSIRMETVSVGPADILAFSTSATSFSYDHSPASGQTKFDCDTTEYSIRLIIDLTPTSIGPGGPVYDFPPTYYGCSETKTFRYNSLTTNRLNNVELYFLDRLGSIVPCNFELLSARSITKSNSNYKTVLGSFNEALGRWQQLSTDSGTRVINTTVIEQLTCTTNWMTVAESDYFGELLTSPVVYIKELGQLWPVVVKTTDIPLPTKANRKNINKVIQIEYANNNAVQNVY